MQLLSKQNQKVKYLTTIQKSKYRKQFSQYLVYGEKLVALAIKHNVALEVFYTKQVLNTTLPQYLVTNEIMEKITGGANTSVACLCAMHTSEFDDGNVLILDNIQDPGNFGTILRTAKACSINNIFIGIGCVDLYNDKVLRSMQGVNYELNIQSGDISHFLENDNKPLITTFLDQPSADIKELPHSFNLMLGNEGQGIDPKYLPASDFNFKLDIEFESLNVAIAAGIIMYNLKERL